MKHPKRDWIKKIVVSIIPLMIAVGCTASQTPQPNVPSVELTAKEINVEVLNSGETTTDLQKGNNININVNDQIILDDFGQGILRIEDSIEADLFHKSEIQVADANMESGGPVSVDLSQIRGQSRIRLIEGANALLTLGTDYATIKTLEQGTEFVVCHSPGTITCVSVTKGTIEFTAKGERKFVQAGESAYVRPGESPSPPICIQKNEFDHWLDDLQNSEEDRTLGQLVSSWPQETCSIQAQAQASPTVEIPPQPTSTGMVKINAGTYQIGRTDPSEGYITMQEIALREYWIDFYEVTNAQYLQYLEATSQQPPTIWPGEAEHPVRGVTWDAAVAYCTWANKRLPTEAEWEVAARGPDPDPPLFPWGTDPLDGGKVSELPRDETYAVGTFPFNQSPFGLYDMVGNVWEWVDKPYDDIAEGLKILRGGRYGFIKDVAFRQFSQSNDERFIPVSGFRCAADQVQGE